VKTSKRLELLFLEEIDVELGSDIATRLSLQHRKGDESIEAQEERGLIWSGLCEFGVSLGSKDAKIARERFTSSMNSPQECQRFVKECERYLRTVVRILISEGPPRPVPERPLELLSLDAGGIMSLARAWFVMGQSSFVRALQAFAKRWRSFDAENLLILQALESIGPTEDRNLAVAKLLEARKLLKLPPKKGKSQFYRDSVLDRLRKRIKRLTRPDRIERLGAKFDVAKAGRSNGRNLSESSG
jgi:hypothetical protein